MKTSRSNGGVGGGGLFVRRRRAVLCAAILLFVGLVASLGLMAPQAAAQGCAMCSQTASASGSQGQAALRHGILILLLPAFSVFIGVFAAIYRRRNVSR